LIARRRNLFRGHAAAAFLMVGAGALAVTALPDLTNAAIRPGVATSHSTTVKPDYSYYYGKTINLIWSNSVGSIPQYADIISQVGQYLHATINMTYVPTGGSVVGLDQAMSAAPDGLTIGGSGVATILGQLIFNQTDPYSFAIKDLNFIIATKGSPNILVACPNSGANVTSMKQFMESTTPLNALTVPGSAVDLQLTLLKAVYGHIGSILTGFSGGGAVAAGCLAGDGQIAMITDASATNSAGNALTPGFVPLMESGKQPVGASLAFLNSQIPDYQSLIKEFPLKTRAQKKAIAAIIQLQNPTNPFFFLAAPRFTPAKYILALRNAFQTVMRETTTKELYTYNNTIPGDYSGTYLQHDIQTLIKTDLPIFRQYYFPS
jgi:tripartite-type tricarboxylate transporter receptor subunit TctC